MEHFVTLFDLLFLPQGLALHQSMERHAGHYTLWILCMDDELHEILSEIKLTNVQLLQLSLLETKELKQVKLDRSVGEYCWTTTPFAPKFVFDSDPSVERVTYLDADLWFRKSPAQIFQEFDKSGKAVLITDHAYSPEYDLSEKSGQYCVQFTTFTREGGETVRKWWEDRCIEWCYARFEDGKFGDQKYLDDWPERFPEQVHVLSNQSWTLAPWNANRFPYSNGIFWHFHELRLTEKYSKLMVQFTTSYSIPSITRKQIYDPYLDDLRVVIEVMKSHGIQPKIQQKYRTFGRLKGIWKGVKQQLWRFNHEMVSSLN
ncbi:MAG: glycosyl transferase [Candidatus Marinimicrobia bacterium]|nr:glycosyl transferase [Candidatus Neomarinimicrobiota bacterium]